MACSTSYGHPAQLGPSRAHSLLTLLLQPRVFQLLFGGFVHPFLQKSPSSLRFLGLPARTALLRSAPSVFQVYVRFQKGELPWELNLLEQQVVFYCSVKVRTRVCVSEEGRETTFS